ncbi:hypothetical protein ABZZ20_19365 [Streptomyces sp. NPDC006430]|uniref:hypothetical protein n=1 Tax=Streptomyces sp. NPDC006430 TaxID=3154299 RepID=UPI0033A271BB
MKRRIRLAVLTPLVVSSLALGAVPLLTDSAQAAAPSITCSVKKSQTAGKYDIQVKGAQPGVRVTITGGSATSRFTSSGLADDAGEFNDSGFIPVGVVTAAQQGTKITCGTVKQAEQQDAQAQYAAGFRKGLADTKADCKKEPPLQGVAPLDPNYERGYNAGAQAALDKYCAD